VGGDFQVHDPHICYLHIQCLSRMHLLVIIIVVLFQLVFYAEFMSTNNSISIPTINNLTTGAIPPGGRFGKYVLYVGMITSCIPNLYL